MGKAGRAVCLVAPMALTIASLICLVLVIVGQLSTNNKAPPTLAGRELYFLKADTSKSKNTGDEISIKDFYLVGLWSYCEGDNTSGIEETTYCSSPTTSFWFNPIDVWGLRNTSALNVHRDHLQKGLDAYRKVVGWMSCSFIVATILTAAEFVTSFFTCFTRKASMLTLILSVTSSIFAIVAATIATAAYGVLTGTFHTALASWNINVSMGKELLLVLWLGVALRVASGPFWLPTLCCCKP
ncbi:hypothetical protein CC86DRAFT_435150 [Ophiobolus disseminans]|uniref:Integral membrane protein-like protein n=1 Tax=Ophiobolus disseminans TaxID=1469910 RepID=A0A6A6ZAQ9_9PLEO|nr:hypothetical protein CC86DRAFT_435150 [Ophiobolus disseminans]